MKNENETEVSVDGRRYLVRLDGDKASVWPILKSGALGKQRGAKSITAQYAILGARKILGIRFSPSPNGR